jgi:hypothetical protein
VEENEKLFSFVFEVRSPSLLFPSCSSDSDHQHGSEYLKLSMKEGNSVLSL